MPACSMPSTRGQADNDNLMHDTIAGERLLPVSAVIDRTSFSRAHIYEMVRRQKFPPPIKISANRIAWPESTVAAWIASKMEAV